VIQSEWLIGLSDEIVSCATTDGRVESVAWDDLSLVAIVTTDDGPFSPDVFWVLKGEFSECAVPLSAVGADELLNRLQALPGFNNDAFIEAMSSIDNNRFICWRRDAA